MTAASESKGADLTSRTVVIHLTDHVAHDPGDLARAQAEARRIFEDIAVRLVWADISQGPEAHACEGMNVHAALLSPFLVREYARLGLGPSVLGFASPSAGRAFVFSDRVREMTAPTSLGDGVLLGRVIAHEVGHLLLGGNRHSRYGIMAANINVAPRGIQAVFAKEEGRSIRSLLASKAADQETRTKCGGQSAIAEAR